jgi:hypothetical protein
VNNNESKIFLTDSNGNTQEFSGALMAVNTKPLFVGVDLGTGPDRTGCGFVYPKLKMGGRALFDKKTADTFTLIYAERRLRALQSWRYHKARPGWIRRRIKNLKRKIKTIRNRYSGDSEWLKNMDFIRNLI